MSPLVIRTGKRAFYEIDGLDEASAYERAVPIMTGNAMLRRRPGGDHGVSAEAGGAVDEVVRIAVRGGLGETTDGANCRPYELGVATIRANESGLK